MKMILKERFKNELDRRKFNLSEIKGFKKEPNLTLMTGMCIGYQLAYDDICKESLFKINKEDFIMPQYEFPLKQFKLVKECPKCGGSEFNYKYYQKDNNWRAQGAIPEHLKVTCLCCKYKWWEECMKTTS